MTERVSYDELFAGLKLHWEWNRDGDVYRSLECHQRPIGEVIERPDGSYGIRLLDAPSVTISANKLASDGCRLWHATGSLTPRDPAEQSQLSNRLRGVYQIPVDDGAGPLEGETHFTRHFETSPIMKAAADRIDLLEALLIDTAMLAYNQLAEIQRNSALEPEEVSGELSAIRSAFSGLLPDEYVDRITSDVEPPVSAKAPQV